MAHLLFVSEPSVLKNQENYPPRYAHDLAVGPAAHLLDIVINCFSAKLGFQANCEKQKRNLRFVTFSNSATILNSEPYHWFLEEILFR